MKYLREIVDDKSRASTVDHKISSHYDYEYPHFGAIRDYQKSRVARAMNGYHWAKHHGEEYKHNDYTNH